MRRWFAFLLQIQRELSPGALGWVASRWPFVHVCTLAVLDRGGGVGGAPLHVVRQLTVATERKHAGEGLKGDEFDRGSVRTRGWNKFMSLAALKSRPGYLKGNQLRIRITFT